MLYSDVITCRGCQSFGVRLLRKGFVRKDCRHTPPELQWTLEHVVNAVPLSLDLLDQFNSWFVRRHLQLTFLQLSGSHGAVPEVVHESAGYSDTFGNDRAGNLHTVNVKMHNVRLVLLGSAKVASNSVCLHNYRHGKLRNFMTNIM